ncbi:MAG: hypothetical protein P9L99_20430 [Candidatus Lernaella stagnicola]|nr:hypothetical protein [Candidatus Lernaella stagnicola]
MSTIRRYALFAMTLLAAAGCGWLLAAEVHVSFQRVIQQIQVAGPSRPWRPDYLWATPERPLFIPLKNAQRVRIPLQGFGDARIFYEPGSVPILTLRTKRDGERSWYPHLADSQKRAGRVVPPEPTARPLDEPLFVFTLEFQVDDEGRSVVALTEANEPGSMTIPLRPRPDTAAGVLRVEVLDDLAGVDPAGTGTASFVALGAVQLETVGGVRHWPPPTPWWVKLLGAALLAGVAVWLWRVEPRWGIGATAAALVVVAPGGVPWPIVLFFGGVGGYLLARRTHPDAAADKGGTAWRHLAWLVVLWGLLLWIPAWPQIVRLGLMMVLPALYLMRHLPRRSAAGWFAVPAWLAVVLIVLPAMEFEARDVRPLREARDPSPILDTWDLVHDTDLAADRNLTVRDTPWSHVGWLGSSSLYGSGLVDRRKSFPFLFFERQGVRQSDRNSNVPEPLPQVWARPGYGDLQLYLFLTARDLNPPLDVLFFYFGGNAGLGAGAADYYLQQRERLRRLSLSPGDPLRESALVTQFASVWPIRAYRFLQSHSDVFQLAVHWRFLTARQHAFRVAAGDERLGRQRVKPSHESVLWGLSEFCRRNGTTLILMPEISSDWKPIHPDYAAKMRRVAAENDHVQYFDLSEMPLKGEPRRDWFLDDVHPSVRGHEMIAALLRAQFALPSQSHRREDRSPAKAGPTLDELLARER